jgi:hypothetical protein
MLLKSKQIFILNMKYFKNLFNILEKYQQFAVLSLQYFVLVQVHLLPTKKKKMSQLKINTMKIIFSTEYINKTKSILLYSS